MPNYVPRARRVDLSFPLCFTVDDLENCGYCRNISESGLMASFEHVPELWTVGSLRLSFAEIVLVLRARVARCAEHETGLSFLFDHEEQRSALRTIVDLATMRSNLAGGLPPF